MATSAGRLVEKLKGVATRAGTQGVRVLVDGTVATLKAVQHLQDRLPDRQRRVKVTRQAAPSARTAPDLRPAKAATPVRPETRPPSTARKPGPKRPPLEASPESPTRGRKSLPTEAPMARSARAKQGGGAKKKKKKQQRAKH